MSAFGNYIKDNCHDSIIDVVKDIYKNNPKFKMCDILQETMEVITYSLHSAFWEIEHKEEEK